MEVIVSLRRRQPPKGNISRAFCDRAERQFTSLLRHNNNEGHGGHLLSVSLVRPLLFWIRARPGYTHLSHPAELAIVMFYFVDRDLARDTREM